MFSRNSILIHIVIRWNSGRISSGETLFPQNYNNLLQFFFIFRSRQRNIWQNNCHGIPPKTFSTELMDIVRSSLNNKIKCLKINNHCEYRKDLDIYGFSQKHVSLVRRQINSGKQVETVRYSFMERRSKDKWLTLTAFPPSHDRFNSFPLDFPV